MVYIKLYIEFGRFTLGNVLLWRNRMYSLGTFTISFSGKFSFEAENKIKTLTLAV